MRISHSLPGLALATLIASYATAALAEPPPPPPPPPDEPGHPGAHHHKGKSDPDAHHKKGHGDHEKGHESEYPLAYVERPLTLSKTTLAPELGFGVARISSSSGGISVSATSAALDLGATFGITKDFEIGASLVPLELSPSVAYGSPALFATYRFVHTPMVEIGGRLRVQIDHAGAAGAVIAPSIPFLFHFGHVGRLDLVPTVAVSAGHGTSAGVGLAVPAQLAFDIIEPLHVGLTTGFGIADFKAAGDTMFVPLGFVAGFAIGGKKPVVDIDPFFTWPLFLTPGGGTAVNANFWTVGLNVKAYIYL